MFAVEEVVMIVAAGAGIYLCTGESPVKARSGPGR